MSIYWYFVLFNLASNSSKILTASYSCSTIFGDKSYLSRICKCRSLAHISKLIIEYTNMHQTNMYTYIQFNALHIHHWAKAPFSQLNRAHRWSHLTLRHSRTFLMHRPSRRFHQAMGDAFIITQATYHPTRTPRRAKCRRLVAEGCLRCAISQCRKWFKKRVWRSVCVFFSLSMLVRHLDQFVLSVSSKDLCIDDLI